MAGSIKDSDIIESDCDDAQLPLQASSEDKRCNLSWKQPWEKFEIKVCLPNGESIAQTDCTRYVSPLKIQLLKSHHLEELQLIIQDIPTIEVKSLIFKEQLFEITLKSKPLANESMEIVTELMKPCDDVIIRPIPRMKFTSKLVESVFRNQIEQDKTDVFRDESTIFIVGFQTMKGCIDDGIVQINRSTLTKTVILKEKWQTIALTKFGIIADLIQQKDDVSVVLQDQTGRVSIQGSQEDVAKAADQLQQMLKSVSVEYISFDPLVLKLLLFKEALEYFNETLKINKIEIEWIVDDEKLCAFGKRNVNSDEIKSVLYTNFVSVGFGDASADCESFCRSQYFKTITTQYMNKMLVCERTTQCVYLAATKNIVQGLLYQEKVHNAKTTKTATEQVNTKEKIIEQLTTEKIQLEAQLDNAFKENTKKTEYIKRSVQERQRLEKQVEELQLKLKATESTYNNELYKKARGILGKLTPQKFQPLVQQLRDLEINSQEQLIGVANLVFEKAIAEPRFSVVYASLCRYLTQIKVPSTEKSGEFLTFREVLLTRCQREFEKDKKDEDEIEKLRLKMKDETDESKIAQIKDAIKVAETSNRLRSLGNIRFIGELFKLKMLTEHIMHACVFKFLNSKDEESLECLCELLRTIGKELDTEKAKPRVDQYFRGMSEVVEEKKISSRVRLMLQDIIELRQSKWVLKTDENNPKTITQNHKEAQNEQHEKKAVTFQPHEPTRSWLGGQRRWQSGSMGGVSTPDGWKIIGGLPSMRDERQTIDPARLKLSKQNVDDRIPLGPRGGAGRLSGWQRGNACAGAETAFHEDENTPGNRFQALSKSEDEDRSQYGVSPAKNGRKGRGFDRLKGITHRSLQEQEKERAVAAARFITIGQTIPREGPSWESSRGREPRECTFKEPDKPAPTGGSQLTEDEMIKKTHAILDEYLHIQNIKEALACVEEINSSPVIHVFVSECINQVLERSTVARRCTGLFLHDLVKKSIITDKQYLQGLNSVLSYAEDMEIDIPKIWQYFGELIGPMVQDGSVPLNFLKEACQPLKESGKAGILVAEILHDASDREGHKKVGDLWKKSGLEWLDFVAEDRIEHFLKDQKLGFTVTDGSRPSIPTVKISIERIQAHLQDLLVENHNINEEIFDWIETNLDDVTTKDKKFIRALMTAVCYSAITDRGNSAKVDPTRITLRGVILKKYLDHQPELELQALYALQALIHRLEHPPGILRTIFDTLYDEDIIPEDAFNQWESSTDPAEKEGKGVAMKQVVKFFDWLREADDEVDS